MPAQTGFDWGVSSVAASLQAAEPSLWPVQPGWQALTESFWASLDGQGLQRFLRERLAQGAVVYPPEPLRALDLTDADAVRLTLSDGRCS